VSGQYRISVIAAAAIHRFPWQLIGRVVADDFGYHRETGHGCICGKRNCEILAIVDADWINDHIRRMHERDAM
jgi:hypothetical protein